MFQYAFARILASELGFIFSVPPLNFFPEIVCHGEGKVIHEPRMQLNDLEAKVTAAPLAAVVESCRGKRVELVGYFQRADYYTPYRDLIRQWFQKVPRKLQQASLHVRGKDFKEATPNIAYYQEALKSVPPEITRVVYTDDPGLPLVADLTRLGCSVSKVDAKSAFFEISDSDFIITSMSTFSWWAAFLSSATVVQPEPLSGWRRRSDARRFMTVPDWLNIKITKVA